MGKVHDILTKTMHTAGGVVEKVAETFSKSSAKKKPLTSSQRTGVTDEEGQDFAAISWDERHIHALLSGAERAQTFSLIPNLVQKRALHLNPAGVDYIPLILKRGGEDCFELDVARSSVNNQGPQVRQYPFARGSVEKLPFKDQSFDFILYPSALAWRSDLPNLIPEMTRCLKDNGRCVLSTVHPYFEYLMNPRGGFRKNIGSLFSLFKQNGLFVDELKEATLEEAMRTTSLPNNLNQELRKFQGMPVVLLMRGILIKKKKA